MPARAAAAIVGIAAAAVLPACTTGQPDPISTTTQQADAGDGWRLLDDGSTGRPWRIGIATSAGQYAVLWADSGLGGDPPVVDLGTEVVIWFGAAESGTCPDVLADVIVADDVVHGAYAAATDAAACTSDARAHAYLIAVERSTLPPGGFTLQVDPPGDRQPEPTSVLDIAADLSVPGSEVEAAVVGLDPVLVSLGDRPVLRPGDQLAAGETALLAATLDDPAGGRRLGELACRSWTTEEISPQALVPPAWGDAVSSDGTSWLIVVAVTLDASGEILTAERNGVAITYRPETGNTCG